MKGGHDLIASERGMWCIALAMIALVLIVLERITGSEWVSFMQWVTMALLAAKTADNFSTARAAQVAPAASA